MIAFWDSLHFVRPDWLWALLLLPAVLLGGWYRRRRRGDWRSAVDAHLLPHLLVGGGRRGIGGWPALLLGLLLAVLALAGPSWREIEQPLWESKTPLVVVLDMSSRTGAADLPPSRLLQVRAKLAMLLRERRGGGVALVAYADEPFTVAPLTDDAANVALFLDALAPGVMPVDGQRADKALEWAGDLLHQASAREGVILLVSDHADAAADAEAVRLRAAGHRVSALGLGTPVGAAYQDREGHIEQARLDEGSLRALAAAGGGSYARLSANDADLRSLGVLQPQVADSDRPGRGTDKTWQDEGYWLLPPLMLVALLAFRRRRQALAAGVLCLWLPLAMPAHAAEGGGWWQRADQRDHQRLAEGVEAYRKGDFATAQRRFEGIDNAQGWYNLGNALARQGSYDKAVDAYDHALKLAPDMADATANRAAVDAARKRKPQGQQGSGQQDKPDTQQGKPSPGQQSPGQSQDGKSKSQDSPAQSQPRQGQSPSQQQKDAQSPQQGQGQPSPPDAQRKAPEAEDAQGQQQADQAQRQRMAEAMRGQQADDGDAAKRAAQAAMSPQERERRQAIEAWMQRVPDEPGDLLKAKFQLEYERRRREGR